VSGRGLCRCARECASRSRAADRRDGRCDGMTRWPGRALVAVVAIAAAVVLASCSTHPATPAHSAASRTPDAATGPATLTTIDGAAVRVPGNRPSVLVFLSINCADCAYAARTLARVEAATKATARAAHLATTKARFLGVDMDRGVSGQTVADFLHSVG